MSVVCHVGALVQNAALDGLAVRNFRWSATRMPPLSVLMVPRDRLGYLFARICRRSAYISQGNDMVAIGFVRRESDGSFRGELKTLTISSRIEIRPVEQKSAERHPDYRVFTADGVEIGTGRKRVGESSHTEYISLALSIPEFGPKRLTANLGKMAGQDDESVFAIIWNPEN